jgi:hypothetical protein
MVRQTYHFKRDIDIIEHDGEHAFHVREIISWSDKVIEIGQKPQLLPH